MVRDGIETLQDDSLAALFIECKDRHIFNPVNNSIDFTTRRATDYELNRSVILPKPMDGEKNYNVN